MEYHKQLMDYLTNLLLIINYLMMLGTDYCFMVFIDQLTINFIEIASLRH